MKKTLRILLAIYFSCTIFTGCGASAEEAQESTLAVYSFSGENELFSISNGVIVLTSSEEIFYGGDLEVNPEKFDDITAYSVTFYIMSDTGKNTLITNSVVDMTGETISVSGDTGKRSGNGILVRKAVGDLQNNLYFELETTDTNGTQNNYQQQLTVTEITGNAEN